MQPSIVSLRRSAPAPARTGSLILISILALCAPAVAWPRPAESRPDEEMVRRADQAFVKAMGSWDKAVLDGFMADGFGWTEASGRTLAKPQLLGGSPQSASLGSDAKCHDYGSVMFLTGTEKTPGAHVRFVRVWVKEQGNWRILLGQQTDIQGSAKKQQATVPAGTVCQNPCKTVPYRGRTQEEEQVTQAWQALETAVNQRNADEWARHVGDEFVFNVKENGNPLTKADRVATIRKQAQGSQVTDIGAVVPGSMDVRVFANTAVMRDTQQPTIHARPYRALRIWVKRDGRWQLVYSQQTTIEN